MGNTPRVQGDRKARAAAARKAAEAAERRRRLVVTSAVVAVVVIVVGVLVGVSLAGGGGGKSGSSASSSNSSGTTSGGAQTGTATLPPWPAPTGAAATAAIKSSGLQAFGTEMLQYHIHAHLDVIDDGKPVTVPPGIGYVYNDSNQPSGLTSLHTHQPDGVIHIEAAKPVTYTLGMFFKEWAVPLSTQCVGKLCADASHTLGFYVDGKKVSTDPTKIPLTKHEEIAIVYAKKGSTVKPPSSFSFTNGL